MVAPVVAVRRPVPDPTTPASRCLRRAVFRADRPATGVSVKGIQPIKKTQQGTKRSLVTCADGIARPAVRRRIDVEDKTDRLPGRLGDLRDLRAIVVNLDRRPDRMDGCSARLKARCPWLKFTRFSATDGRATTISASEVTESWNSARNVTYQKVRSKRKGWNDLDTYQARRLPLSAGERGCASSHVRAWRACVGLAGDSDRPLLVLEDDAAPTAEFTQVLGRALASLPPDAGVLYLGYSQAADWRREITPELAEAEYVWTTVGYIIWPHAARKLLSQLPVNEPVDNFMAGQCAEGNLKAYCVRPKIVLQADAWNVNSDVAHSDEHYWGPDSDIRHTGTEHATVGAQLPARSCLLGENDSDSEESDSEL